MSNVDQESVRTWEQVAAEAAQETDPHKLLKLASELNHLLARGWRRPALQRAETENRD